MTLEAFSKLPLLLSRKTFQEVTGLGKNQIDRMVESHELSAFHRPLRSYGSYRPERSYRLYPKSEAARIGGLKL